MTQTLHNQYYHSELLRTRTIDVYGIQFYMYVIFILNLLREKLPVNSGQRSMPVSSHYQNQLRHKYLTNYYLDATRWMEGI